VESGLPFLAAAGLADAFALDPEEDDALPPFV